MWNKDVLFLKIFRENKSDFSIAAVSQYIKKAQYRKDQKTKNYKNKML